MLSFWQLVSDSLILLFFLALIRAIHKRETLKFFISFFIVLFTVWLIKSAFKIPRPELFNSVNYGYSFISMHAALAFQAIYFLKDYVVLLIWPILIAISRLKLGVHRFIDILLGGIYGFFVPYLIDKDWKRLKRNFLENEREFFRKLVHLAFYLSFPFLTLYNLTYFYAYTIFALTVLAFIIITNAEIPLNNPVLKSLTKIKRENESLLHITYYPLLLLILALFFNDPKLVAFVGLTFSIGDALVGILNILIRNYGISLAITSFYLFLIVSAALDLTYGLFSVFSFLLADFIAKKLKINDNYVIPLVSFLVYFFI